MSGVDEAVRAALGRDELVDITTKGRRSGGPRRVEIWFHYQDGQVYITGTPGRRGWYANLLACPEFTLHLKQSLRRDVPARAAPVVEEAERRRVFTRMRELEPRMAHMDVERWVRESPLVAVELQA